MRRFFSTNIQGNEIVLDAEESRHLSQVLRLQIDDQIEVVNGLGELFVCKISSINKKGTLLTITDRKKASSPQNQLWMAVAPTKNINRWEWFLEKATEIGIGRISPIICKNSERKHLKIDRQLRILKEAMKQSKQLYLPQLDELMPYDELLKQADAKEKYIAHCYDGEKPLLKEVHQKAEKALILIGPEGDFDLNEVDQAKERDFQEISLSESRLRTETAAIVACHTINLLDA